ncbi:Predicted PurR-regulated permease PerM [Actinopolyspora lacussalsi subsp. righensis]|uniref:Predicted PurR-regulated permease PerM n=1 Tax=Actinopolyspora righensis TaxID=995060 RepID=A0A1I7AC18_9ACTN|nr:AI-2E family transporter [Actinopolyspora righensis]SFT72360.1 Predicted PurR-regulated permease PerM [Actinopolyspora righensis]
MSAFKVTDSDEAARVPVAIRATAALSWRVLVILGMLYALGWLVGRLSVVVIPVAIALLLSALLAPAVAALSRLRVPRGLATAVVLVGGLAALGGILTFVINAFIAGLPDLQRQLMASLDTIREWAATGPLHLGEAQINRYVDQVGNWLQDNQQRITSGALATATTFGSFLTGMLLMLFTLIFFLHDGRRIWLFLLGPMPEPLRSRLDLAGTRGFDSLIGYIRATGLVAVGDALGIGIGLAIIGVPLVVPLAALVFLAAFIPIVGAVASGAVAILVALVAEGPIAALLTLGVVLGVQQLEGNVLQPLLIGRAVRLHPLAVVLAISVGAIVAGIIGTLLAVPVLAVLNSAVRALYEGDGQAEPATATVEGGREPPESDSEEPAPE